jgi:hypothetical protein
MPCALTTGYKLGCRDNVGGITEVRLIAFNSVTGTIVVDGSGVVTGTFPASGFYKYEVPKGAGQFTETVNASTENGTIFYQQELVFPINRMTQTVRNELRLLGLNRLMAIVTDRNGKYWLLGRSNGLDVTAGTAQTGTAMGDRNGYEMTFTGMEELPCSEVSSSIISALTSGTQITGGS